MAKILVADDDELQAALLQYKLEGGGHHVTIAENGDIALRLSGENMFDLIVLDSMMPVLSGVEVLKRLRSGEKHADTPIIMLTSRKSEADVVNALNSGANDYITKPFIPAELLIRVDSILKKAGKDRGTRAQSG